MFDFRFNPTLHSDPFDQGRRAPGLGSPPGLLWELVRVRRLQLALRLRRVAVARMIESSTGALLFPCARTGGDESHRFAEHASRSWSEARCLARAEVGAELPLEWSALQPLELEDMLEWALELDASEEGRLVLILSAEVRRDIVRAGALLHELHGRGVESCLPAHAATLAGDVEGALASYELARERAPDSCAPLFGALLKALELGAESHVRVHAASLDELLHPEDQDLSQFVSAIESWRARGELAGGESERELARGLALSSRSAPYGPAARRVLEAFATAGASGDGSVAGAVALPARLVS